MHFLFLWTINKQLLKGTVLEIYDGLTILTLKHVIDAIYFNVPCYSMVIKFLNTSEGTGMYMLILQKASSLLFCSSCLQIP